MLWPQALPRALGELLGSEGLNHLRRPQPASVGAESGRPGALRARPASRGSWVWHPALANASRSAGRARKRRWEGEASTFWSHQEATADPLL